MAERLTSRIKGGWRACRRWMRGGVKSAGARGFRWVEFSILGILYLISIVINLWGLVKAVVFYSIWMVIAAVTIFSLLVEVDGVSLRALGGGAAFGGVMLRVVGDNSLAVFFIELCCFIVHGYAWNIPTAVSVINKFSSLYRPFDREGR